LVVTQEVLERRSMQIHLLGVLEASVDDRQVALGGAKRRAVLAMLALEANHVVTADRLVEGLWGEDPPASAEPATSCASIPIVSTPAASSG
jgi:DNA-binding response OmpR family regulator